MAKRRIKKNISPVIFAGAVLAALAALLFFYLASNKPEPGVKVYFFKEDSLVASSRPLSADESPLKKALSELLAGPKEKGLSSQIPPQIRILKIKIANKTAIIDFSRNFEEDSGGASQLRGMIKQIVYTATEIPGIEKVWIWVEGKKEIVLGGEGLVLDHPLTRGDVSD